MPAFKNTDDAMMGLHAGITTIMEMLVSEQVLPSEGMAQMLAEQRDKFLRKKQPDSAAMIEMMRRHLLDPRRAAARRLLKEPPHGQG